MPFFAILADGLQKSLSHMKLKSIWNLFRSAILAGICISLGGWVFLACKGSSGTAQLPLFGEFLGAAVFAFGLLAVIHFKFKLYTGTIGFVRNWADVGDTFIVLLGNIAGCLLVAMLSRLSPLGLQATAGKVLEARLALGPLAGGCLAAGCGFIMTTAVLFGRREKWLPLIFGIPMFILCGFPHCIADAFYYLAAPGALLKERWADILILYPCLCAGNFLGCNLVRLVNWSKEYTA